MAEWFKAPVLKTGVPQGTGGSNPSPSAIFSCIWSPLSAIISHTVFYGGFGRHVLRSGSQVIPELRHKALRPGGRTHEEQLNASRTVLPRRTVTVPAYAKINLTLELLGVRPDGYHDLRSVVVPVDLHDDVEISVSSPEGPEGPESLEGPDGLGLHSSLVTRHSSLATTSSIGEPTLEVVADGVSLAELGPPEKNLAVRAARLFFDRLREGRGNRDEGTENRLDDPLCIMHCALCIKKRIPLGGGLGGGSADAAAVLLGLNSLVTRHSSFVTSELMEIGAELGSDIPALVHGGTVLMEGRGERVSPVAGANGRSPLPPLYVVLANPGVHVSTAEAYRASSDVLTSPTFSCNILSSPDRVGSASACAAWLFNGLERAVFARHPEVAALAARMREAAGGAALMSGSGATVFALADDAGAAERVRRAVPAGCWCEVTRILPDGVMAAHGPLEA